MKYESNNEIQRKYKLIEFINIRFSNYYEIGLYMNEIHVFSKGFLKNKNIWILILPLLIFPIMVILEIVEYNTAFKNTIIQAFLGIYFIFFIPLYPIFIFPGIGGKERDYFYSRRMPILITSNLSIFVVYALFCRNFFDSFNWLGVFSFSISVFFVSIALSISKALIEQRRLKENTKIVQFLKNKALTLVEQVKSKKIFPKNYMLLLLFLVICGILVVVRFPGLFGDDPWYHAAVTAQMIEKQNFTLVDDYYESLIGLYSIGAFFQLLTGLDIWTIARIIPILTMCIGGMLGYSLVDFFLKNQQIAIIGGIIFTITPLDNALVLGQYWPTSFAIILGLGNFLISLNLINTNKNRLLNYIFFYTTGISIFFFHDYSVILFFGGFMFVYIIQAFRRKEKIFGLIINYGITAFIAIILGILGGMVPIYYRFNVSMPIPPILWIFLLPGAGVVIYIAQKIIKKPGTMSNSLDQDLIPKTGKRSKVFQKEILIFVLITSIAIGIAMFFIIPILFKYAQVQILQMVINIIFIINVAFYSISGIITIQRKNFKTDIFFFFIVYFLLMLMVFLVIDTLFTHRYIWTRIAVTSSGIVSLGSCAYIYLQIKRNSLLKDRFKKVAIVISISLFLNFGLFQSANYWIKSDSEINTAQAMTSYLPEENTIIISGFRWTYIMNFYSNFDIDINWSEIQLIKIENQINQDGENLLLMKTNNSFNNVYLLLDFAQQSLGILGIESRYFGKLTDSEIDQYYNLQYLNKVLNMKCNDGNLFSQLYIVIS
jgi:hypothetical protein